MRNVSSGVVYDASVASRLSGAENGKRKRKTKTARRVANVSKHTRASRARATYPKRSSLYVERVVVFSFYALVASRNARFGSRAASVRPLACFAGVGAGAPSATAAAAERA